MLMKGSRNAPASNWNGYMWLRNNWQYFDRRVFYVGKAFFRWAINVSLADESPFSQRKHFIYKRLDTAQWDKN